MEPEKEQGHCLCLVEVEDHTCLLGDSTVGLLDTLPREKDEDWRRIHESFFEDFVLTFDYRVLFYMSLIDLGS